MPVSSIAFVAYPVTDMPRALAFYEGDLGLKKTEFGMDMWAEFAVGQDTFAISTFDVVGKAGASRGLALEIADLDAFRSTLIEKGHTVSEPQDQPTCRISMVSDPDGNQIWLHEAKPR